MESFANSSVLGTIFSKMPWQATLFLIMFVIVLLAFYVLPRVKRDKQGKLYFHSDRKETIKQTRKLDFIIDKIHDMEIDVCKGNVFTTEMPIGERMASAIKYLNAGGNGETKKYIADKLKPKNPEMYNQLETMIKERGIRHV